VKDFYKSLYVTFIIKFTIFFCYPSAYQSTSFKLSNVFLINLLAKLCKDIENLLAYA